jgi:hypothetical protein
MKLLLNKNREGLSRLLSSMTATVAVLGCLALGARTLTAGDGSGPMAAGGGDAIGSLPFQASPPPESLAGSRPSIVFEGPSLAAIKAVVVDAWGEGYAEISALPEGGVRVELQGSVGVHLDRHLLHGTAVSFGLDVSQGFSSGLAVLTQGNQVIRTQALPEAGDLDLPLAMLCDSGVLDEGGLTLHSFSLLKRHHGLDLSSEGGLLRLVSHE